MSSHHRHHRRPCRQQLPQRRHGYTSCRRHGNRFPAASAAAQSLSERYHWLLRQLLSIHRWGLRSRLQTEKKKHYLIGRKKPSQIRTWSVKRSNSGRKLFDLGWKEGRGKRGGGEEGGG